VRFTQLTVEKGREKMGKKRLHSSFGGGGRGEGKRPLTRKLKGKVVSLFDKGERGGEIGKDQLSIGGGMEKM